MKHDQAMVSSITRYANLMVNYPGFSATPKLHLAFHMVRRTRCLGNPQVYATWKDEADNKRLKAVCRNVPQLLFEKTVLVRMHRLAQ